MNNATKIMGTRPPLVYLLMLRDVMGIHAYPYYNTRNRKKKGTLTLLLSCFYFSPCGLGGKIQNGYNFLSRMGVHFTDVEVHRAGFLSEIAPSLLPQYIISISLLQVASFVSELAVI